jgi:hypothetical protein
MLCRYTFMVVNQADFTGHILTIDAMGCQRGIAEKIRDKGADYVLALSSRATKVRSTTMSSCFADRGTKPVPMAISDTYSESGAGRVKSHNGWNKNRHGAG